MLKVIHKNTNGIIIKEWEFKTEAQLKCVLGAGIGNFLLEHSDYPFDDGQRYELIRVSEKDNVNNPSHYTQGKVECIDALESATVGKKGIEAVCVANVVKYLWRYEEKNGLEDVKKAEYYLKKLIDIMEKSN